MICRIWHGWSTHSNADAYELFLRDVGFPSIEKKEIQGYHGIQLLRKEHEAETEFVTIMWFDTLEDIKKYAGEDYEKAAVLGRAKEVLSHYDPCSQHYQIKINARK